MTTHSILQLLVFIFALGILVKPCGWYIAQIFQGKPALLNGWGGKLENSLYRLCGIKPEESMTWKQFAFSLLVFNLLGFLTVYALQRLQSYLPLNPQHFTNIKPDSAFNTAISFVTNTNWQNYAGESAMSYFTQMLALTVQNFISAATGIAVLLALIRGLSLENSVKIGNFWVDITRAVLYIFLPFGLLIAIILMSQGVIQNFHPYQTVHTLTAGEQILPMGPVASQEAIKLLGTNGGGFFNVNSAHPFENPTPLSNFVEMLSILLLPASLCYAFGLLVKERRQGWMILSAMLGIFLVMALGSIYLEQQGNPSLSAQMVDQSNNPLQTGGNMEGKETRFGITGSALFATITTATSCGATNSMHDSYTPIGGMLPLWLMQLGEVVFGGVGAGLYGMLVFIIVAVFIGGLLIGRTPEYLGKKIESFEIKMAIIAILIPAFLILAGTAIAVLTPWGKTAILNPGPHGFSEILYAFSSASNNNGSAFAGLSVNTPFYNVLLGICMWFGRYWTIVPILALAGSLAEKKKLAYTKGSLPTHGFIFVSLLIGTILLVGALTFLPTLALGPIAEWVSR